MFEIQATASSSSLPLNPSPALLPFALALPASMAPLLLLFFFLFFNGCSSHLLLPLTSSFDSTLPTHHHLLSASLKSTSRHTRFRRHRLSLPLSSGSDYTLSVSVGSTTPVTLFLDTGSDLVWFPCSPFTCMLCEGKNTSSSSSSPPHPPPPGSSLVSCMHPSCTSAHSSLPVSDLCAAAGCPLDAIETSDCAAHRCPLLYYAYGDGSLLAALRSGHLAIAGERLANFTFACAHSALAEPTGVAGFGRGPLSLPAQLAAVSPSLSSRFSYCLVSHSFKPERAAKPSPLILGRSLEPDRLAPTEQLQFTPLLHNPKHPYFYSVALESIAVGSKTIAARPELGYIDRAGNGGMVVDSGTTFTMLPTEMYLAVADEFHRAVSSAGFRRSPAAEAKTGLRPCYLYSGSDRAANRAVPRMEFRFRGNASVELPRRNYFFGFDSDGAKVGCLMLMDGGADGGPAGTFGNFQQQGLEVVYDVEGGRVGFARRRCSAMWESLAAGGH